MTKKCNWICDICKKEFEKSDAGYDVNVGFDIVIPAGGQFERDEKFHFVDTCYECRVNLSVAINELMK